MFQDVSGCSGMFRDVPCSRFYRRPTERRIGERGTRNEERGTRNEERGTRNEERGTKAPAKRSQHANTTYRNIVGRNMLRAFGHPVATC